MEDEHHLLSILTNGSYVSLTLKGSIVDWQIENLEAIILYSREISEVEFDRIMKVNDELKQSNDV